MAEIGVKTARGVSPELLPPPPRGSYLLSEIVNDSGMTGATAKDVFDAGATPEGVSDAGGSAGTVATGFALADHVHDHGDLRGGSLHALASAATHGFMDKADKAALDALVAGTLIIENRTSDPASPVSGQIWLRTDL